jgi:hypothetical protein
MKQYSSRTKQMVLVHNRTDLGVAFSSDEVYFSSYAMYMYSVETTSKRLCENINGDERVVGVSVLILKTSL